MASWLGGGGSLEGKRVLQRALGPEKKQPWMLSGHTRQTCPQTRAPSPLRSRRGAEVPHRVPLLSSRQGWGAGSVPCGESWMCPQHFLGPQTSGCGRARAGTVISACRVTRPSCSCYLLVCPGEKAYRRLSPKPHKPPGVTKQQCSGAFPNLYRTPWEGKPAAIQCMTSFALEKYESCLTFPYFPNMQ